MRRPTPKRPPVQIARNLIQGGSGGVLGGAVLGLVEACYHLAVNGAPDFLSPFYATLLYGLIGLPLGVGAGVLLSIFEKVIAPAREETAWATGFAGAMAPMLTFILYYLANKVVYLEMGVPTQGKLTVLALGLGIPALFLLVLPFPLHGGLNGLLRAKGLIITWGAMLLVTGAVAEAPLRPDPHEGWGHHEPIPAALKDRPNVLFFFVDTLRADRTQPYGADLATPTVQALADDGVLFEKNFAQASWTRSSGASIFTSLLPSAHNAETKASRLSDDATLWSEVLHDGGYTTGALVNNINLTAGFGFDQGWDTFYYESPDYRFGASESVFALTLYKVVQKLSERALPGDKVVTHFYQPADHVLGDARQFIQKNEQGRWALFVHLMEPHDPYFEHPSVEGTGVEDYDGVAFARAEYEHPDPAKKDELSHLYDNEVVYLDRQLKPFFEWLKASGHYEDTLIVFTADHGEEFDEHGGFWHGTTLYDEVIHVPLILKLPHEQLKGTRVPWQVRSIDIAPTIAATTGQKPAADWEGRDLIGDVRAEAAKEEAAAEVAREAAAADAAPDGDAPAAGDPPPDAPATADAPEAPGAPVPPAAPQPPPRSNPLDRTVVSEEDFEGNVLASMREKGFKYLRANQGNPRGLPPEELYDVVGDPGEQHGILGSTEAVDGQYPEDVAGALSSDLKASIAAARKEAVQGGDVKMSASECARLKALGYLSGDEACN